MARRNAVVTRDRGWSAMLRAVRDVGKQSVKVGILSDAPHDTDSGIGVAELGAIHEYGAPRAHIPERSFLRRTIDTDRRAIAELIRDKLAPQVARGALDVARALGLLGAFVAARVKLTITAGAGIPPPLQAATVKAKGSSRPLVDTGRLLGAITWAVDTTGKSGGEGV